MAAVDADRNRIAARRLSDGVRAVFDGDYVREHITHGYAVTVHTAPSVTADATHSVLGEKATRAALYVAMTRGRESNTAYLYERVAEASEYSNAAHDVAAETGRERLPMRVAALLIDRRTHTVQRRRAAHAIGAQRPKRGRRVTNRAPTNTYASRLTTASSCNAGPRNLAGAACDAGA